MHKCNIRKFIPLCIGILLMTVAMLACGKSGGDIFRASKVQKIEIGDEAYRVKEILGNPCIATQTEDKWEYFDAAYEDLIHQMEKTVAAQELALLKGDMERLAELIQKEEQLQAKMQRTTYKYICITFDNRVVQNVLFEPQRNDTWETTEKTVQSVSYAHCDTNKKTLVKFSPSCTTYYTDGSFYRQNGEYDTYDIQWIKGEMTISAKNDLEEITLFIPVPNNITNISGAFQNCHSLTSITIPDSITSIGYNAFFGCYSLTSITIPDSVTSIGNRAFYNCSGLTSITIPNSVTSIGDEAFDGCSGLTSITIPNNVTSIGDSAFRVCSSLTSITIPNSVTSIGGVCVCVLRWLNEYHGTR